MEKTNWIIIKHIEIGTVYGVGSFINNMLNGLITIPDLNIFVIEIDEKGKEFYIDREDGITFFHFNYPLYYLSIEDNITNQTKYARNIVCLLQQYIPENTRTIVHINFVYQCFIGAELKKTFNASVIFTQHLFIKGFNENPLSIDMEKQTYELADQVITVTRHGKEHLVKRGYDGKKISVIYNGIDPGPFKNNMDSEIILKKYGIKKEEKYIIYSGRLDTIKGLNYLAKSFKILLERISDCRLIIAGDGDYIGVIQSYREFSSNFSYIGFIPFQDLVVLYQNAAIGVIPSLEEHCSYVALEMLHAGLPVVASSIGGLKEIFIHNENALLVDTIADSNNIFGIAPEIEMLADSLHVLLTNKDLRTKFSLNAQKRAKKKFTSMVMAEKYVNTALKVMQYEEK